MAKPRFGVWIPTYAWTAGWRSAGRALLALLAVVGPATWQHSANAAEYTLTWIDHAQDEDGFRIERKLGPVGPYVEIAVVGSDVTTFVDPAADEGVINCYRVRAFNWLGNSGYSNEACTPGGVFVAAGDLDGDGTAEIVTGAGEGGGPHVRAFAADGSPRPTSFFAYGPAFTGGVRVAACDFDQPPDGRAEIVTGAGPGGGPHVRVIKLDGAGQPAGDLASFLAYSPGFTGGVFVACGDVDGDGRVDVVTGADAGGGPHVQVFKLDPTAPGGVVPLLDFFAFAPQVTGGVRVAAADVDGSGRASIVVAAGPGGGPHVRVLELVGGVLQELASFFAYGPQFSGGVFVAAGDMLGGGRAEIVTGAGPGGGPHIRVFTGAGLDTGVGFFAYDPAFTGGVRVAVGKLNGGSGSQIVTGPGPSGGPHVRTFTGAGAAGSTSFLAY
jgi:hypothetical protein